MKVSVVGSAVRRRKQQLTLQEVPDTNPVEGEIVYITKGNNYRGSSFYYLNGVWGQAQMELGCLLPKTGKWKFPGRQANKIHKILTT